MFRWMIGLLVCFLAGCGMENQQVVYDVQGQVIDFKGTHGIVVKHDPIADFMDTMTMSFTAADSSELRRLTPGDSIRFRWVFGDQITWIENVERFHEGDAAAASVHNETE